MTSIRSISDKMWHGRKPGAHVLDFTAEAVVLRLRTPSGEIHEVGRAVLDAQDFLTQIDALRVEALVQDPARRPIVLWLPETQVLQKQYILSSTARGPARAEAMRRLQAETGYAAEDLTIDIEPGEAGEASTVLATLCQTVREARDYAERWGFNPGIVSTEVAGDNFRAGDADFRLPVSKAFSTGRKIAQAAAVTAIIVGGGFVGLKVYEVTQPLVKAITLKEVPGHLPLPSVQPDLRAEVSRHSAPVVRFSLQSMPLQRLAAHRGGALSDQRLALPLDRVIRAELAALNNPSDDVPIYLGGEARLPIHNRPGRLGTMRGDIAQVGIAEAKRAVDRIRRSSRAIVDTESSSQRPKFQRADSASVVASVAIQPAQAVQASVVTAVLANAKPLSRSAASALTEGEQQTGAAASLVPNDQTQVAGAKPEEVEFASIDPAAVALPTPRPTEVPAQTEAELQEAVVSDARADDVKPLRAEPKPERASPVPTSATSEQQDEATPDPDEQYAALTSPKPTQRPERLRAADPVLPKKTKAISVGRSPTRVGSAANERGLELSETNLVGVIEASNGRRALVRLPDGDFRKVARGDEVNGWLVNSIERAAMRLTRQGQNRTLLLVLR